MCGSFWHMCFWTKLGFVSFAKRRLGQFGFRPFPAPLSVQLTPYRRLGLTIHSLFRAPDHDLAHVDLAPGKSLEGLLQGRRIKRNDFGDFGLELPFLGPSNGLL